MTPLILFIFSVINPSVRGSTTCNSSEFACASGGQCISLLKWQDGVDDCFDASDEVCLPWQFDCQFGAPRCIAKKQLNDGQIDCYSGVDEGCPSHYFVCHDRSGCIPTEKFNDVHKDCGDGSDEPCGPSSFPCNDGSGCIPIDKFQDGKNDCKDGSDEECTTSQLECGCGRVRCVEKHLVGDGSWDCEDGSDELFNTTETTQLIQESCPDGSLRRSGSNSLLVGKVQLCKEDDECHVQLGQLCIVVGGAQRCVCHIGMVRPPGSVKCIPVGMVAEFLRNPNANCTELNEDLLLELGPISRKLKKSEIRRAPSRSFGSQEKQLYLDSGNERIPYMFSEDEDPFRCDPKKPGECAEGQACLADVDGLHRCACEGGRSLINGNCTGLVNECASPATNDCDPSASCMDSVAGYECLCREGFLDVSDDPLAKPGRKCLKLINECASASTNKCDPNAKCLDRPVGYSCRCNAGYIDISAEGARRPGRNCTKEIDECTSGIADCDAAATCRDEPLGYSCRCPMGYVDVSPEREKPGRACAQLSVECEGCPEETSQCLATNTGNVVCMCKEGLVDMDPQNPGRNCSTARGNGVFSSKTR